MRIQGRLLGGVVVVERAAAEQEGQERKLVVDGYLTPTDGMIGTTTKAR